MRKGETQRRKRNDKMDWKGAEKIREEIHTPGVRSEKENRI